MVEAIGIIIWVDRQLWYLGLYCIRSSVPAPLDVVDMPQSTLC